MFQPLQPRFVGFVAHSRREAARNGSTAEGRWTLLFPAGLQVMGFEARNLGRARMIREAEASGPTPTWWLGKTGECTTDVLRREALLVVCSEREAPKSHLSCKETGIAAKPGRDGPTPSGAGSGSTWMEGGFREPVKAGST